MSGQDDSAYNWAIGEKLPTLHTHSFAKHNVLRKYLRRYVEVVTGLYKQQLLKISFVDGFSGGGLYLDPQQKTVVKGSPIILLEEPAQTIAEICANSGRQLAIDAKYYFCELRKAALEHLEHVLKAEGYNDLIGERVFLIRGRFEDTVPNIIEPIANHSRSGRSIFLLDQYGYNRVSLEVMRYIFSNCSRAEIILTFNIDWMLDRLAPDDKFFKIVEALEIDPATVRRWHDVKHSKKWRIFLQNEVYEHIVSRSGATSFTKFFISSSEAHRAYWKAYRGGSGNPNR